MNSLRKLCTRNVRPTISEFPYPTKTHTYPSRLNARRSLRGKGYDSSSFSFSTPSSHSAADIQFGSAGGRPDREHHGHGRDRGGIPSHELSDLRAAWPSQLGDDSVLSASADRGGADKSVAVVTVQVDASDVEAQERTSVGILSC